VRVLVIDDSRPNREALAQLLAAEAWTTGAAAVDRRHALDQPRTFTPDVSVLSVADGDGVSIVRLIVAADPDVRVVVVGLDESDAAVLAYAEAGAAGFVMHGTSLADLLEIVGSVARGESPCSPRVAATLLRRLAQLGAEHNGYDRAAASLTAREREILELLAQGRSNKEIAGTLRIELRTVKNHVHNILTKLRVNRRGEAVARVWGTRPASPQLDLKVH